MRAVFLILGLVLLGFLLIFAIQNASSLTNSVFKLAGGQAIMSVSMVPIIIGAALGIGSGLFLGMFIVTKEKKESELNDDW